VEPEIISNFVEMSKKTNTKKRFLASLLASVYLFAVMFSGFFHTHTNNYKQDLFFVKNAADSSKVINFGGTDDCFSLHFFNAGIGILTSESNFQFFFIHFFSKQKSVFQFFAPAKNFHFFSLRAPPVFI
jgi:hypothetical protein